MKLQGQLIKKEATKAYGSNNFLKREIVIKTPGQYPQTILIELLQDNTTLADGLNKDEVIEVSININGREWVNPEGKTVYFNSIVGWKIERVAAAQEQAPEPNAEATGIAAEEPDDLPF